LYCLLFCAMFPFPAVCFLFLYNSTPPPPPTVNLWEPIAINKQISNVKNSSRSLVVDTGKDTDGWTDTQADRQTWFTHKVFFCCRKNFSSLLFCPNSEETGKYNHGRWTCKLKCDNWTWGIWTVYISVKMWPTFSWNVNKHGGVRKVLFLVLWLNFSSSCFTKVILLENDF
jgi:hypothetical protein